MGNLGKGKKLCSLFTISFDNPDDEKTEEKAIRGD